MMVHVTSPADDFEVIDGQLSRPVPLNRHGMMTFKIASNLAAPHTNGSPFAEMSSLNRPREFVPLFMAFCAHRTAHFSGGLLVRKRRSKAPAARIKAAAASSRAVLLLPFF